MQEQYLMANNKLGNKLESDLKTFEEIAGDQEKQDLIQFRVEKKFFSQLSSIAERLQLSPGILARLWVAERLQHKLTKNGADWTSERIKIIEQQFKEQLLKEPYLVIHIIPLSSEIKILPKNMQAIAQSLRPPFRRHHYIGRIDHFGFRSSTVLDNNIEVAYVQLWKSGQLESVGNIPHEQKQLYGSWLDKGIVDSVTSALLNLAGLQVPPPFSLCISLLGIKDYTLRNRERFFSNEMYLAIEKDQLIFPAIEITNWNQVTENRSFEPMAKTLKPILDELWNASGYACSPSFDSNGDWIGPDQ